MEQPSFLGVLAIELAEVEVKPVKGAINKPAEEEIGVLDDTLKRLYTFRTEVMLSSMKEAAFGDEAMATKLKSKATLLDKLFWYCLSDVFNVWDRGIGVREGWKVVTFEEPESPFGGLIRGIGGAF